MFRREGEYWTVVFGGDAFRLKDSKGLQHLARLLAEPGREFHVLDTAAYFCGVIVLIPFMHRVRAEPAPRGAAATPAERDPGLPAPAE